MSKQQSIQLTGEYIQELQNKIAELEKERTELLALRLFVTDISNMCIGELTMGYKLDAQEIGESIYAATHMGTPEMNEALQAHNLEQQAKGSVNGYLSACKWALGSQYDEAVAKNRALNYAKALKENNK